MSYPVTGGAGFIGSNLAEALLSAGHRVQVLDIFLTGKRENLAGIAERFSGAFELRYFNVFGSRQDPASMYAAVIPWFITSVLSGKQPVVYGDVRDSLADISLGEDLLQYSPTVAFPVGLSRTFDYFRGVDRYHRTEPP